MSTALPADGRLEPATPDRRELKVVTVEERGPYPLLVLEDQGGPTPSPGQFYMLSTAEEWGGGVDERPYLPRAISIMDRDGDRLEFLLDDVGPGTARLAAATPGSSVLALGPLGRGFRPGGEGRPVICAGGIGVAPMVALARALGSGAEVLLGFRDSRYAQAAELFPGARVATDDGSAGHAGTVIDLLEEALDAGSETTVYACGPPGMLEAVRAACARRQVPSQLALESGMACGFGACYGCVVATADGGYRRVCVDGPVLEGSDLADGWQAAYG